MEIYKGIATFSGIAIGKSYITAEGNIRYVSVW